MIIRTTTLPFRALSKTSSPQQCVRSLHKGVAMRRIPEPTPFVPDHETFLKLIGRGLSQYASKIESWKALFSLTSQQLADLGVEPPNSRRYLLQWREKFRNKKFGVGGDLTEVQDGVAEIRVIRIPFTRVLKKKDWVRRWKGTDGDSDRPRAYQGSFSIVANVPAGAELPIGPLKEAKRVKFMQVKSPGILSGPHIQYLPGTGRQAAKLEAKEGLWEIKLGHKIDGGERRRAEVRAKRQAAINREKREKAGI